MTGPWSIPKTNWPWPPPGHTTSGAVRTGEGHHEMPGLPYPAFRRVNAEPGGGKPSPYTLPNSITTQGQASCLPSCRHGRLPGTHEGRPYVLARAACPDPSGSRPCPTRPEPALSLPKGWPWHDLVAARPRCASCFGGKVHGGGSKPSALRRKALGKSGLGRALV